MTDGNKRDLPTRQLTDAGLSGDSLPPTIKEVAVTITANDIVAPGIGLMTIEAPYIAANLLPGQFIQMAIPGFGGHILRRPFSVFRADASSGLIDIVYQAVGAGTRQMLVLKTPLPTQLHGPVGHGWLSTQAALRQTFAQPAKNASQSAAQSVGSKPRCLLVGGGLGCAPLFSLAQQLCHQAEVHVVLGAQSVEQMIYEEYFATCIPKDRLIIMTDDGTLGEQGFTTQPTATLLASYDFDYLATCGPEPMQRLIAKLAADHLVPCEVSLERRMACGLGACLSCAVDTNSGRQRACVDGPVFDATEVVW